MSGERSRYEKGGCVGPILFAVALILFVTVYAVPTMRRCDAKGGKLVQRADRFGYACVDTKP